MKWPPILLAVVLVAAACSGDDTGPVGAAPASAGSHPEASATPPPGPTPSRSEDADPPVGTVPIDDALRVDEAVVVTVTGYRWGVDACEGRYFATGEVDSTGELVVEVEELIDGGSPSVLCTEQGFTHALTVVGGRGFAGGSLVDAATSTRVEIGADLDAIRPGWLTERTPLPDCGEDVEYAADYPNRDARECFRRAYDGGQPAELRIHQFGDEGESGVVFFRILDDGELEALEEQRPPAEGEPADSPWDWRRHQCTSFHFIDDPGGEVDDRPVLNWDGECVGADLPGT